MESKFHCQKTKDRGETPFCVLEKMRITDSNLEICKKNSLKSYRKLSSGKGNRNNTCKE